MEWVAPKHSRQEVNRAGQLICADPNDVAEEDFLRALNVVNNWRASHSYPLNTFKVTLRRKASEVDSEFLVAQRIKRMSSIDSKLRRFPNMQLSRMQDLGGCRAIVGSISQVDALVAKYENSRLKHSLHLKKDYIRDPKESGYRGVHLVYRYMSQEEGPSRYNGLSIEMQLRSRLQHAWATAVETVGTFLRQSLKSSQGEEEWLRFFALMSVKLAQREGVDIRVPNTPRTDRILRSELEYLTKKLNVRETLQMFKRALKVFEGGAGGRDVSYYLLRLEPQLQTMRIRGYPKSMLSRATEDYLEVEKEISNSPGSETVLVAVASLSELKRAYPNYFLDTDVFLRELKAALK